MACDKEQRHLVDFGKNDPIISIEDFSDSKPGGLPNGWEIRDQLGKKIYSLKKENSNQYLHALDKGDSVLLLKKISWNLKDYPVLKWSWMVRELPKGANERHGLTNDSAAAVYVLFKNRWFIPIPKYIKYVWSSSLPVGESFIYKLFRGVIVLESGDQKIDTWITESVNISEDYKKIYGEEPTRIVGIGILTDANATHSTAEASYDDFEVSS